MDIIIKIHLGDTIEVKYKKFILSGFYENDIGSFLLLTNKLQGNKKYAQGSELKFFDMHKVKKIRYKKLVLTEKIKKELQGWVSTVYCPDVLYF